MILNNSIFLDIQNRAKQLRLNHVFNIFNEIGPEYLRTNFTRVLNSHNHNTRNRVQNFVIPKNSTVISGSFYYNAIMDWSSLSSAIKSISNKPAFKRSVRAHLINEIGFWCTFFNHLYLFWSCMLLSNVSLLSLFLMLVLKDPSGNKLRGLKGHPGLSPFGVLYVYIYWLYIGATCCINIIPLLGADMKPMQYCQWTSNIEPTWLPNIFMLSGYARKQNCWIKIDAV